MSSKLYVLRNNLNGVWCAAYHNGSSWRVSTRDDRRVKPTFSVWWDWRGNPVETLGMEFLCEVNNFKEKSPC